MSSIALEIITLIPATETPFVIPVPFVVSQALLNSGPVTLLATGIAGVEEVEIYFSVDSGVSYVVAQQDGDPVVMTRTHNTLTVNSPIYLGIVKATTANPVGVFAQTNQTATQA